MPAYQINVATISWISRPLMAGYKALPLNLLAADAWLRQLAYGMAHTSNSEPPSGFDDQSYNKRSTLGRQYRALTTFTVGLRTSDTRAFEGVTSLSPPMPPDPGYTPPFDEPFAAKAGAYVQELIGISPGISREIIAEATKFSPGEASSLSAIAQPEQSIWQRQSTNPLPYGSICPRAGETVLAHSLVKFRAGAVGDRIGIVVFGAPNHVPWVWCEAMLTYATPDLILYCAGSIFPSHAFYLGGVRQTTIPAQTSLPDLKRAFTSGFKAQVSTFTPPVVVGGVQPRPVVTDVNAQVPTTESATATPLDRQPYCAPAGVQKRIVVPIASMAQMRE